MKKEEMIKIINKELELFLPRIGRGSMQNLLRSHYNTLRRIDLAKENPEGSEAILTKCHEEINKKDPQYKYPPKHITEYTNLPKHITKYGPCPSKHITKYGSNLPKNITEYKNLDKH